MSSARPLAAAEAAGDGRPLLDVARASIRSGIERGRPLRPDLAAYPAPLRAPRASFVTLHLGGALRGCVGGLEPVLPLVVDVAEHAFAAACRDPRFAPLAAAEVAEVDVEVSIVSPLEPISFRSEDDLVAQLRPGVDGLVLVLEGRRGAFLPAVWDQLPAPREFLRQLKRKAGLPDGLWSSGAAAWRYTVEVVR